MTDMVSNLSIDDIYSLYEEGRISNERAVKTLY